MDIGPQSGYQLHIFSENGPGGIQLPCIVNCGISGKN